MAIKGLTRCNDHMISHRDGKTKKRNTHPLLQTLWPTALDFQHGDEPLDFYHSNQTTGKAARKISDGDQGKRHSLVFTVLQTKQPNRASGFPSPALQIYWSPFSCFFVHTLCFCLLQLSALSLIFLRLLSVFSCWNLLSREMWTFF